MDFDYKAIGRRIKMTRLERELTQEQLAEITGLSTVHISNVETANTKVSLQSLVKIANALHTSIDGILYDNLTSNQHVFEGKMVEVIRDCNAHEIRVIADTAEALKRSMRQINFPVRNY